MVQPVVLSELIITKLLTLQQKVSPSHNVQKPALSTFFRNCKSSVELIKIAVLKANGMSLILSSNVVKIWLDSDIAEQQLIVEEIFGHKENGFLMTMEKDEDGKSKCFGFVDFKNVEGIIRLFQNQKYFGSGKIDLDQNWLPFKLGSADIIEEAEWLSSLGKFQSNGIVGEHYLDGDAFVFFLEESVEAMYKCGLYKCLPKLLPCYTYGHIVYNDDIQGVAGGGSCWFFRSCEGLDPHLEDKV